MDPELSSLASTAATTVVQLLTTDAWERLKSALGSLWSRSRPGKEAALEAQLDESRAEVMAAGDDAEQVRTELTAEWQGRLRRLLAADPAIAAELRRVLDEELGPILRREDPGRPDIRMRAVVSDQGRAYQAGHDMHITER
jgi:hypothetical protein